jgi:hypothetical protein
VHPTTELTDHNMGMNVFEKLSKSLDENVFNDFILNISNVLEYDKKEITDYIKDQPRRFIEKNSMKNCAIV